MSLPIKVSLLALKEITEIQRYLERYAPKEVDRFQEELAKCFGLIVQFPGGAQVRYRNFRALPLDAFEYLVIYSIRTNCMVVHRVRHTRRRPLKRYFGG